MDEATVGNTLRWYQDLEDELAAFLKVVPPQGQNLKTRSPKLSTILVEACTLTESVFYCITPISAEVRGNDRERMGLAEYAELYCGPRRLAERKVAFFQEPLRWVEPFGKWIGRATGFQDKEPLWWKIYTRAKHRRLNIFPEATLQTAIDALAGALVTIVTEPELLIGSIRHGWLPWHAPYYDTEALKRFIADFFKENFPFTWLSPETQLFAVPLGPSALPDNIHELRHPSKQIPLSGHRLGRWLGTE